MRARRLLAAVMLAGLLSVIGLGSASAATHDANIIADGLTVPVTGQVASGTLHLNCTDGAPGVCSGTFDFQGTIDGVFTSASGTGTCIDQGDSILMTIDDYGTWTIPFATINRVRSATVTTTTTTGSLVRSLASAPASSDIAYVNYDGPSIDVFGVPVAFSPALSFPVEGTFTVSDPASGEQPVTVLPNTGVGPATHSTLRSDRLLTIAAGLAGLSVVGMLMGRTRRQLVLAR